MIFWYCESNVTYVVIRADSDEDKKKKQQKEKSVKKEGKILYYCLFLKLLLVPCT